MRNYIKRSLESVLKRAASEFPAIVLTGPRQSGKTTLLQHLFGTRCRYVSLEPLDIQASALQDPRSFLEMYPPPIIFDEVQYAPELLPYIKERIDANRQENGQYLLTGSQNLLLAEKSDRIVGRSCGNASPVAAFQTGNGRPSAACPSVGARAPVVSEIVKRLWQTVAGLPPRRVPGTRDTTQPRCIPLADQLYPDLSRTGRAYTATGWGPDPVSKFSPNSRQQKCPNS